MKPCRLNGRNRIFSRIKNFAIALLSTAGLVCLAGQSASAVLHSFELSAYQFRARIISSEGQVEEIPISGTVALNSETMNLETEFQIQPPWILKSLEPSRDKNYSKDIEVNSPGPNKIQVRSKRNLFSLQTTLVRHNQTEQVSLLVQIQAKQTSVFKEGNCNFSVQDSQSKAENQPKLPFLFLLNRCQLDSNQAVKLDWIPYEDAILLSGGRSPASADEGIVDRFQFQDSDEIPEPFVSSKAFGHREIPDLSRFQVEVQAPPAKRTWSSRIGLSTTVVNFFELNSKITNTQVNPTVSAGTSYTLWPKRFDLSLSGYSTIFPFIVAQSAGERGSWSLGLNSRLTYRIPYPIGHYYFSTSLGYYITTMRSLPPKYGFSLLAGPQIFTTMTSRAKGARPWVIYLKFAPLAGAFKSTDAFVANREVAIGGAYQLSPPTSRNPISITTDFSNLTYTSFGVWYEDSASISTFSLGVSYGF